MKFSDFESVEQVLQKYPLALAKERFLPHREMTPPERFIEELNFAIDKQMAGDSEMYFREYFITPFMRQVWMRHSKLQLWVNRKLAYKDELYGEPDYFLSFPPQGVTHEIIGSPLLAVVEAKREDFTKGWGQCLAEMIACQKINDDEQIVIYGIVSTGVYWEFGKLQQDVFIRHSLSYSITHPALVLGVLDYIFAECEKQEPRFRI